MFIRVSGRVSGTLRGRVVLVSGPPVAGKTLLVDSVVSVLLGQPPFAADTLTVEVGGSRASYSGGRVERRGVIRFVAVLEDSVPDYVFRGCAEPEWAVAADHETRRVVADAARGDTCSYTAAWLRLLSAAVLALTRVEGPRLLVVDGLGRLPHTALAEAALVAKAADAGVDVLATVYDAKVVVLLRGVGARLYEAKRRGDRAELVEANGVAGLPM